MADSKYNRSPWDIEEKRFTLINSTFQIRNTLEFVKKKHRLLTLCGEGLETPLKSVILKLSHQTLQIDKPIDWPGSPERFKIFFRDQNDTWNFMVSDLCEKEIYQLSLFIPGHLHKLTSRWHKRVETPYEARARFRYNNQSFADLQILNLSASGMLVCSGSETDQAEINSTVNNITIDIDDPKQPSSTIIDQGIVVRSYQHDDSGRVCHGITFIHKDQDSLQNLHRMLL
ncbi:MAG: PilZ domain-containing protein [Proteobacteria bacterium]|nr:PilZ domain-containing protein [Pseudomonadota bacterium]MBU1739624.1 PilZ domain-containing protein [Pseudomonadota bacterium]